METQISETIWAKPYGFTRIIINNNCCVLQTTSSHAREPLGLDLARKFDAERAAPYGENGG